MKELNYKIVIGDSVKVLPNIVGEEQGTYSLCITSPPYWDLVKYNSGDGDLSLKSSELEFEESLTTIFKNIHRLLNTYGTLCVQWEDITINRDDGNTGEYMLCSINHAAEKAGFRLYSRFIWKKFSHKMGVMYSTYKMAKSRLGRPNPSWTYLFVYKSKHFKSGEMSPKKSEVTAEEWKKWSDPIWEIPNPSVEHHNTPFAPEIVERILKLYTAPYDRVIDPFLGSGTTMKVCMENSRSCTGIELNSGYVDDIKKYVSWGQQCIEHRNIYKLDGYEKKNK